MWRLWLDNDYHDRLLVPALLPILFALSLILLGVLIVIEPALLAWLVAMLLITSGVLLLVPAVATAWLVWRRRPRRIRLRTAR